MTPKVSGVNLTQIQQLLLSIFDDTLDAISKTLVLEDPPKRRVSDISRTAFKGQHWLTRLEMLYCSLSFVFPVLSRFILLLVIIF